MKRKRMKKSNERVSLHNDNIFLIPDDTVDWRNPGSFKGFLTAGLIPTFVSFHQSRLF